MPDAGSYIYSGDPENRAWFRQTKVHQTLTLNEKNSQYAPKLLLWKPSDDLDILVVENQSYDSLTHRRAVLFIEKRFFVIIDEAFGNASGNIDLHFQLGPGNAVYNKEEFSAQTDFKDGWNVWVKSIEQKGMIMEEEEGQVSFEYTKKMPRPAFRYRMAKNIEDNISFVTIVAPYKERLPNINVKMKTKLNGSPEVSLKISNNGVKRKIAYHITK